MSNKLFSGFILFSSLFFFIYSLYDQEQNWDMLGYASSAISLESEDPVYIHDYVYNELRNYVSDEDFEKLTNGSSYRKTMFEDPDAFIQQIPYFKIRIVFVSLIFIFGLVGRYQLQASLATTISKQHQEDFLQLAFFWMGSDKVFVRCTAFSLLLNIQQKTCLTSVYLHETSA